MSEPILPFPRFPADPRWRRLFIDIATANAQRSRMQRGRDYLEENRLQHSEILPGMLTARVQGSQRRPYRVQITTPLVGHRERRIISSLLRDKPELGAALQRGELPVELDALARRAGAPLVPRKFRFFCTCPDAPSAPCKHGAALLLLAADEFGEHPLHLLLWRGLEETWWHDTFTEPPDPNAPRDPAPAPAESIRAPLLTADGEPPADEQTALMLEQLAAPWRGAPTPDAVGQPLCERLGPLPGDEPGEPHTRRLRQLCQGLVRRAREEAEAFRGRPPVREPQQRRGRPNAGRRRHRW